MNVFFLLILLLCFAFVFVGLVRDLFLYLKEVYCSYGSKENKGIESGGIFHAKAGGIPERKCGMDTGKLRA